MVLTVIAFPDNFVFAPYTCHSSLTWLSSLCWLNSILVFLAYLWKVLRKTRVLVVYVLVSTGLPLAQDLFAYRVFSRLYSLSQQISASFNSNSIKKFGEVLQDLRVELYACYRSHDLLGWDPLLLARLVIPFRSGSVPGVCLRDLVIVIPNGDKNQNTLDLRGLFDLGDFTDSIVHKHIINMINLEDYHAKTISVN